MPSTARELHDRATEILVRAANENRNLTDEEHRQVSDIHDQIERTPQPTLAGGRQQARSDTDAGGSGMTMGEPETTDAALGPEQRCADWIRSRRALEPEQLDMSIGRFLRSMFSPRHRTAAEQRALAEGTDTAGGHTVPDFLAAELIDLMRARNQAMISGARTVPLESDKHSIAKLKTDPSPGWRAENASVSESDPTFEKVEFKPKSMAVFFKASQELIQDSSNLEAELPRVLAAAMAAELDRVVFLGSGSGNEPAGLDNIANVQSLDNDGAITDYSPFIQARRLLLDEDVDENAISNWVMAPKVEEDLGALTDTTGQPLQVPPILNRPRPFTPRVTSKLPTNLGTYSDEAVIYGGAFNQLAIGMRLDVTIRVLTELYAENLQVAFLAYMRADIQAIRPKHLIRITGVRT